jgi:hypothetical protein
MSDSIPAQTSKQLVPEELRDETEAAFIQAADAVLETSRKASDVIGGLLLLHATTALYGTLVEASKGNVKTLAMGPDLTAALDRVAGELAQQDPAETVGESLVLVLDLLRRADQLRTLREQK